MTYVLCDFMISAYKTFDAVWLIYFETLEKTLYQPIQLKKDFEITHLRVIKQPPILLAFKNASRNSQV